jgi:hypothetical protein
LLAPPEFWRDSYFWSTWRLPAGASVSESGVWAGDTWTVGGAHGSGIKGVECKFAFMVTNLYRFVGECWWIHFVGVARQCIIDC